MIHQTIQEPFRFPKNFLNTISKVVSFIFSLARWFSLLLQIKFNDKFHKYWIRSHLSEVAVCVLSASMRVWECELWICVYVFVCAYGTAGGLAQVCAVFGFRGRVIASYAVAFHRIDNKRNWTLFELATMKYIGLIGLLWGYGRSRGNAVLEHRSTQWWCKNKWVFAQIRLIITLRCLTSVLIERNKSIMCILGGYILNHSKLNKCFTNTDYVFQCDLFRLMNL